MNGMLVALVSLQGLAFPARAPLPGFPMACINASYSRADEVEITNDLGHLIIGAFVHHGPAFYEHEVTRCLDLLQSDPDNYEARNDLGAAYTKLGKWEDAEAAFADNERRFPDRYETASNLGVMYKKMGRFTEAESAIRDALRIKPGGHMGLGDYYLKMIQWQSAQGTPQESNGDSQSAIETAESPRPTKNFLGVPYKAGTAATAAVANKEYLVTLIKNDMAFSDAYLVLGDVLFEEKDYQLALRAYHRANYLSYDQSRNAHARIAHSREVLVIDVWQHESKPGHIIESFHGTYPQLDGEIAAAKVWLGNYQSLEHEFVRLDRDVSFAALKPEAEKRGITKPRLLEAVYYEGTASTQPDFTSVAIAGLLVVIFVFLVFALGAIVFLIRKSKPPLSKKPVSR